MSDNEENSGKKRRPDFFEQSAQPQKRQRVVNLEAFVPNRDLISDLTQLGQNLSLVSDAGRVPETEISDNFLSIQRQINDTLQAAFNEAQLTRRQNEEQRMASEMAQMGQQERDQFQNLRDNFLRRLQPLTQRMSEQLTYGEQSQMFNIILQSIDNRLNENDFNNTQGNPALLLMELATITTNFAIEQLSVTLSNIYQASPNIVRQLISIITASGMVYNYLPNNIRSNFLVIPYLGPLFALMNRINPVARNIQNSAAAVTTIYYLLRNAGIDTSDSIALLGSSAQQLVTNCALETGQFICRGAGLAVQSAQSLVDGITDRLGDILTSEYQDLTFQVESQESVETGVSMRSISSPVSVNTNQTQNSERSMATGQTVEQLLNTPLNDGGISINLGNMAGPVVEQRLIAIADPFNNANVIPDNIYSESLEILTQPPSHNLSLSLETVETEYSGMSSDTTESDDHWSYWLFGPYNSGSGGFRKRNRNRNKSKGKNKSKTQKNKLDKSKTYKKAKKLIKKVKKLKKQTKKVRKGYTKKR